jgi:hypothetical protein
MLKRTTKVGQTAPKQYPKTKTEPEEQTERTKFHRKKIFLH